MKQMVMRREETRRTRAREGEEEEAGGKRVKRRGEGEEKEADGKRMQGEEDSSSSSSMRSR